jgi:hypothetical protein
VGVSDREPTKYALQVQLGRADARASELETENRQLRERVAQLEAERYSRPAPRQWEVVQVRPDPREAVSPPSVLRDFEAGMRRVGDLLTRSGQWTETARAAMERAEAARVSAAILENAEMPRLPLDGVSDQPAADNVEPTRWNQLEID